jgi:integrase/recombinase XerD
MTPLRQRMIDDMRIRGFSPNTEAMYVRRVAQFARFLGRSPETMTLEDVRAFQAHLAAKGCSAGILVQCLSACRFLYRTTLGKPWDSSKIPYPKRDHRIPFVVSREEVMRLLGAVRSIRHRTILTICYAEGLRISEARALRIRDIDSKRMVIHVHMGKGRKDRIVPLSESLLALLRQYWRQARPTDYLFFCKRTNRPVTSHAVSVACKNARIKAGITRKVTAHTLRHCFATHLLEGGVDVRLIQRLLGHSMLETTAGYLDVATDERIKVVSPLDRVPQPS